MQPIITESALEVADESGTRTPVRIYVRSPFVVENDYWGCYCHAEGLWPKEVCLYGEDSFQALCIAIELLRTRLQFEERRGKTFYYGSDDSTAFPIDIIFGRVSLDSPH